MTYRWNLNLDGDEGMHAKCAEARAAGHTRLFAIAYESNGPLQWHSRSDEAGMQRFLASREESESILFNCAIAVVVVNPQDPDETIMNILASGARRVASLAGYFDESF